jgi:hypothetical protein
MNSAVQPNNVAMLNKTIHAKAAGCNPLAINSFAPMKMIPRLQMIVRARNTEGPVKLTGTIGGAVKFVEGKDKFAPQRLQ